MVDWVKAIPFVGTGVCAIETIKAAANGNGKQALIKLAETGFSGAMDAVTVVTAGAGGIATFSAKTAGKVAASAAIKNVAGVTLVRTVGTTLLDKGAEEAVMDGYIDMSSGNRGGSSDSPRNTTSGGSSSTNSRSTTTSGSRSTSNNTGSSGGDDERPKKTPSNHGDDAEEYEEIDESSDEGLLERYKQEMERRVQDADVQALINQPLTANDGRGTLYIYVEENAVVSGLRRIGGYKIGMTKCDPSRRIDRQENQNNSLYRRIYYRSSYLRRRAERVTHLLLKEYRCRRENIAGGTEWFYGPIELFMMAAKVAEKWVNKKWRPKRN